MVKDKKVLPHLSSYANDPERIEEQANLMAKEGWILEKFGSLFSTYRRGKAGEYGRTCYQAYATGQLMLEGTNE